MYEDEEDRRERARVQFWSKMKRFDSEWKIEERKLMENVLELEGHVRALEREERADLEGLAAGAGAINVKTFDFNSIDMRRYKIIVFFFGMILVLALVDTVLALVDGFIAAPAGADDEEAGGGEDRRRLRVLNSFTTNTQKDM